MAERTTDISHDAVPPPVAASQTGTLLDLLHRLTEQLSTLFRQEVRLAGAEISRSLTTLFLSLASVAPGQSLIPFWFLRSGQGSFGRSAGGPKLAGGSA
jgi:hypothetical protein